MAIPSALSVAALEFRKRLAVGTGIQETDIFIGHPKDSFGRIQNGDQKQRLNIFFYRLEPGGYPSDGGGEDPLYVRAHCLITPMGVNEPASMITSGENDLRLIGSVMQTVHEHPMLPINDESGDAIAQIQIVQSGLSLDDINHLWSTQGDTPYRLSVGYELALLPIPLAEPVLQAPRVASVGLEVTADPGSLAKPFSGLGTKPVPPAVSRVTVDVSAADWAPHIAFLSGQGTLQYVLSFAVEALPAGIPVIVAGEQDAEVELVWEIWEKAAGKGWQPAPDNSSATAKVTTVVMDPGLTAQELAQLVATLVKVPLNQAGQATLYAQRTVVRANGSSGVIRSNPLLVSVIQGLS